MFRNFYFYKVKKVFSNNDLNFKIFGNKFGCIG